jgi:hypothetical protein
MAEIAVLCSLCSQIFHADRGDYQDGHTWDGFKDALNESCYICLQAWNNINKSVNGIQSHWAELPCLDWKMAYLITRRGGLFSYRGRIGVHCTYNGEDTITFVSICTNDGMCGFSIYPYYRRLFIRPFPPRAEMPISC